MYLCRGRWEPAGLLATPEAGGGEAGGKLDGRLPAVCTELLELHRNGGDASQVPVARMLESL